MVTTARDGRAQERVVRHISVQSGQGRPSGSTIDAAATR
ncbi:MAG: hypothetical protein JWR81_3724, partial [Pseudonocardia sp.]|nr:hypothetical protein [Pseudonocardia sp.]